MVQRKKVLSIDLNCLIDSASCMVLSNLFHSLTQIVIKMLKTFSSAENFLEIVFTCKSCLVIRSRPQIDVLSKILRRQTVQSFIKNVSYQKTSICHLKILNLTPCKSAPKIFREWLQLLLYMLYTDDFRFYY